MIIVGVDPGSNIAGLAVLELAEANSAPKLLALDFYETNTKDSFEQKLQSITNEIKKVFEEFKVDCLVLEDVFTGKNAQSAFRLAEIRGAATYVAMECGAKVIHYPTRLIKKSVTGNGNASKEEVAVYLKREFSLPDKGVPLDATDALALAYHQALQSHSHMVLEQ